MALGRFLLAPLALPRGRRVASLLLLALVYFGITSGSNAMNFFLVREIKGGGSGFTILGIVTPENGSRR